MSHDHTPSITVRHAFTNIFRYIEFICMQFLALRHYLTSFIFYTSCMCTLKLFHITQSVIDICHRITHHACDHVAHYSVFIVISRYPSFLTQHALHSFLISIMAKTSRSNPGSPNASDNSRMPTRKKKADEDAKMTRSPKRRKATIVATKRPVRSTRTTAPSPTTTTTTSPQKR